MIVADHVGSMLSHAPLGSKIQHQGNFMVTCKHSGTPLSLSVTGFVEGYWLQHFSNLTEQRRGCRQRLTSRRSSTAEVEHRRAECVGGSRGAVDVAKHTT